MPAEGDHVLECRFWATDERVGNLAAGDAAARRYIAAGDSLGHGHHVRGDAPVLGGEHLARAAKSGDHLVGDEQAAVLVADLPQPGPIIVTGDRTPRRAGDGLGHHRAYGLRVLEFDHLFDRIHAEFSAFLGRLATELAAVGQRLGHVEDTGHERLVIYLGVEMRAAQCHRTHGGAVV